MLAKKFKIRGRLAIQRVFEKGRKIRLFPTKLFSLHYLLKRNAAFASFSVITPRSLKLNAVERNRIRRRVYEAIHKNFALTKGKNYDIVIVVHNSLEKIAFPQIETALINLLRKLP